MSVLGMTGDVATGSCTGTIFIKPGSRAVATFPGLGSIALTVS
jgi:2-keto-4-pentenoate hydratase